MSYKLTLDNKYEVKLKDGFTISEELSEMLDSGVFTFYTKEELDIEPYDEVKITGQIGGVYIANKRQIIDKIHIESINPFDDSEVDKYDIDSFSATKYLEKITLPNLAITHSKVNPQNRSVYYYINQYINLYSPKIRIKNANNNIVLVKTIELDSSLIEKFYSLPCPEFQWNKPTLRELLTDLMMVGNCIPKLECDGKKTYLLKFLDLSDESNSSQIDKSKLNKRTRDFTSTDYCSELTLEMENTLSQENAKVIEYINFKNPDGGQILDTDFKLETTYPIYDIKSLKFYYCSGDTGGPYRYIEVDITANVLEEKAYNVLPEANVLNPGDTSTKLYHIKFARGGKIIDGFSYSVAFLGITNNTTLDAFIPTFSPVANFCSKKSYQFKVEYYTQTSRKMHIGKYLPNKRQIRNFDAQTNSYADPSRMSIFEYHKVNRIGNMLTTIGGTYTKESDVPQLGDKLDDNILFSRTLQYRDDCIIFEGTLTKNYILQDYFTGVNAKRRSWEYVAGSDALTRYDVDKYYCEFSYSNKQYRVLPNFELTSDYSLLEGYILKTPMSELKKKQIAVNVSLLGGGNCPSDTDYGYVLDTIIESNGLSLLITSSFFDNFTAGKFNNTHDNKTWTDFYEYVDYRGETQSITYYFAEYDAGNGSFVWKQPNSVIEMQDWYDMSDIVNAKPIAKMSIIDEGFKMLSPIRKDNSEIIAHSFQFEFCSDTEEIIVGDALVKDVSIISTNTNLRAYVSHTKPSLMNRNMLPSDKQSMNFFQRMYVSTSSNEFMAILTSSSNLNYTTNDYIYITNTNDEVIFALKIGLVVHPSNQTLIASRNFFFNVLQVRDDNIYDTAGNVIGNIISGVS